MSDRARVTPGSRWRSVILAIAALGAVVLVSCAREPDVPEEEQQGLWSRLKDRATDVPHSLVQTAIDQTEGLLETLNDDYAPVLREAGFEIAQVRVSIGVPPGLALRVRRVEIVSKAKQEELLAEHGDDETLAGILKALFALHRVEAEGYEMQEIMIHSDLPPRVTLILVPTA